MCTRLIFMIFALLLIMPVSATAGSPHRQTGIQIDHDRDTSIENRHEWDRKRKELKTKYRKLKNEARTESDSVTDGVSQKPSRHSTVRNRTEAVQSRGFSSNSSTGNGNSVND